MKIQQIRRQVTSSMQNPLQAKANPYVGLEEQDFAQGVGTLSQGMQNVGNVATQALARRNDLELQDIMHKQQVSFDAALDAFQSNRNILDADDLFETEMKRIRKEGEDSLSFKGMRTQYEMAFDSMSQGYRNQFDNIRRQRVQSDGVSLTQAAIENKLKNVGTTYDSARAVLEDVAGTLYASSAFFSPAEIEVAIEEYGAAIQDKAIAGLLQQVFETTEGSPSERYQTTIEALHNQDIGELTAEETERYRALVQGLEVDAIKRRDALWAEEDQDVERLLLADLEALNIQGAYQKFLTTSFHDNQMQWKWNNYFTNWLDTDEPDEDEKTSAYIENLLYGLEVQEQNGDLTTAQHINLIDQALGKYGGDPKVAKLLTDAATGLRNEDFKSNNAYNAFVLQINNEKDMDDFKESDSAIYAQMVFEAQRIAQDIDNEARQDPQTYRDLKNAMMTPIVVKKLNDTIGWKRGDIFGINSSEEITQYFQEGQMKFLIQQDENGQIDTSFYRSMAPLWGLDGEAENIEQDIETYMNDFRRAGQDEFGSRAIVDFDNASGRPMIVSGNDVFALQVITDREKDRLEDLGLKDIRKKDEAWYRWDASAGEYVFHKMVEK